MPINSILINAGRNPYLNPAFSIADCRVASLLGRTDVPLFQTRLCRAYEVTRRRSQAGQPEHSFSPLASNNLWRPSVTSHARSGDRHNQAQDGRFPRRLAPRKDWSYHVRLGFSPAAYLTHATVCGGSEPPPYKGKSFLAWLSHLPLCITIYLCIAALWLFC